jgi:hypothetical protein
MKPFIAAAAALISIRALMAQPGLEAYDRGDMQAVKTYLAGKEGDGAERLFLQGALTADADSAIEKYRQVVLRYPESPISLRAMDRVQQYFYAQGKYEKAAEFEKILKGYSPPVSILAEAVPESASLSEAEDEGVEALPPGADKASPPATEKVVGYILQVGAFSNAVNAKNLEWALIGAGYRTELIAAGSSSNRLHTVRVVGFSTEKEAVAAANELKKKHGLHAIVAPILSP